MTDDPIVDPQRRRSDPEPVELPDTPLGSVLGKLLAGLTVDETLEDEA